MKVKVGDIIKWEYSRSIYDIELGVDCRETEYHTIHGVLEDRINFYLDEAQLINSWIFIEDLNKKHICGITTTLIPKEFIRKVIKKHKFI